MKTGGVGPERVLERMAFIQARMNEIVPPASQERFEIYETDPKTESSLFQENSFTPADPFGPDLQMEGPQAPSNLTALIHQSAIRHGVDPYLFQAVVSTESDYRQNLVSSKGAMGLAQLMPETARGLGVTDPFDPVQNLDGGAKYFACQLKRFNDPRLALAAYNAGPGAVKKYHNQVPPYQETQNYVQKVLARYQALKSNLESPSSELDFR